jgi:outer membrane protein assembly factor BamB
LFYVVASQSYSIFYLTGEGKAEGFAGRDDFLNFPGTIKAIDYRTGDIRWTYDVGSMGPGLLTTAGDLLFTGDSSGHVLALDAAARTTLWHTCVGANQTNGAITYELDGKQYVVVGAVDTLAHSLWLALTECHIGQFPGLQFCSGVLFRRCRAAPEKADRGHKNEHQ